MELYATGKIFPMPFAGLRSIVTLESTDRMLGLVAYLSGAPGGCGHKHALGLFPERRQVWVSDLGLECSKRWSE